MSNNNSNLNSFSRDLSSWNNLTIYTKDKEVHFSINEKEITLQSYQSDLEPLRGIGIEFYGCGFVDWITLLNERGEETYRREF